jgi:hypothetical protein
MKKRVFREAIRRLLREPVEDLSLDRKASIIRRCMIEAQHDAPFDESNKGNPWTDEELRVVLLHAPTRENCILLARAFRRGYGSIEQVFRWAATPDAEAKRKRPDDAFVRQIKRVAKQVGWRAS